MISTDDPRTGLPDDLLGFYQERRARYRAWMRQIDLVSSNLFLLNKPISGISY